MTTPTSINSDHPEPDQSLEEVIAWLNHEASLLEILTYRLNGLTNVLRSSRHAMVCTAASDVDTVHDQLIRASVHRDLALLALSPGFDGLLVTASDLEERASDADREALRTVRQRIDEVLLEVDEARAECDRAADAYRAGIEQRATATSRRG